MKVILKKQDGILVRFDRGDEVMTSLKELLVREKLYAGFFTAIGATMACTISFYDIKHKKYIDREYTEDMEIVSCMGNISIFENEPLIHAHGVFSKLDYSTVGGHIKKMIVGATCEMYLVPFTGGVVKRVYDEETGLNLIEGSSMVY